ncbi:MAG: hypothetical protein GWN58_08800, partial [Anaerolineae bacterium]|nr:hypothetical protein [Anaerolineae bacterium]
MIAQPEGTSSERFVVDGTRLYSLRQINELPTPEREEIYRHLLPNKLLEDFGINTQTLSDAQGNRLVTFSCPHGASTVEVDVRSEAGFPDPLLYVELGDTRLNQIEVILFVVNDPSSERFETDRDWRGERTMFGTLRRNIPEEIRAMEAGLAPGQVRQGLRLSRTLLPIFESFVTRLGHDYYLMEPLTYHTAILFERLGCNYVQGLRKMQWLHDAFQPGGLLHGQLLDGASPFRQPDACHTIRGRSWAIHDGIMGEPWHGIKMYKRVGRHAGIDTFPG